MDILKGVSLKLHSTMRLGGKADFLYYANSRKSMVEAAKWAETKGLPIRVIGSGSNIIWRDEGFKGLVIVNNIKGFRLVDENNQSAVYKIGAGENWDKTVERLVNLNLYGVECLSLIPGTVGATPVQNVGAYGQDISQTLINIETYDLLNQKFITIDNSSCMFGYRTSRFKTSDSGRFMICSVTLKLSKKPVRSNYYEALDSYFKNNNIDKPSIIDVRNAVIAIRSQKLPDPLVTPNTGSFFSNPIISETLFKRLQKKYPDIKAWKTDNGYKIAAGWLLEKAGFKDKIDPETGMTTWKNQALVLVNHKARFTKDLINYQDKITEKVFDEFEIKLEREPEILP